MTLPSFVAAGTGSSTAPAWPGGYAVGDLGLLLVTSRDRTINTPSGWTRGFPQIGSSGTTTTNSLLDVFYRFATSTSESTPSITSSAGSGTIWSDIVVYTGVNSSNPFHVSGTIYLATNPNLSPGLTTQLDDCLILCIFGMQLKNAGPIVTGHTNDGSTLTSLATDYDAGTTSGVGAYLIVFEGAKAAKGDVGITRDTTSPSSGSSTMLTVALQAATQALGHKSRAVNTEM